MIKVLKRKLQEAKEERATVVAPYDARIKKLSAAIKSLEDFDTISTTINASDKEDVTKIPSVDEAVEIQAIDNNF